MLKKVLTAEVKKENQLDEEKKKKEEKKVEPVKK